MTDFTLTKDNAKAAKGFIPRYPEGRQASAVLPLLDLAQQCFQAGVIMQGL